ncbi:MAG: DUF4142 domain-containing protein [Burkholderiaceae bacterium]
MTKLSGIALALAASSLMALAPLSAVSAADRVAAHGTAKALNATDRDFIAMVGASLKFEAAAAELAQKQASRDLLKSYGKKDVAFIERLTAALEKIAKEKSVTLAAQPTPQQTAVLNKLKGLQGDAFDQAFVKQAGSAHHFDIVNAFKRTAEKSVDVDVRGFARTWLDEVNQRFTMVNAVTSDVDPAALKPSPDTAPRRGEPPRTDVTPDASGKATN